MTRDLSNIRNFAIIAHIDHGKSTLADRIIEKCSEIQKREMQSQLLDNMDIERERGITIKAQTVHLKYKDYEFNLMDTPGHVDFAYEVSRSLASCEGSLLIVDATQGVEAQTLANVYQAIENDHEIIPVLNKIDLPSSDPDRIKQQIEDVIGIDASDALMVSGKTGEGVPELLDAIAERLPAPKGNSEAPLQALLIDSWYDPYLGVMILIRVTEGTIRKGDKIKMMMSGAEYTVDLVGVFDPKRIETKVLEAGSLGYITASIKKVADCKVGDTITHKDKPCEQALDGFKPNLPVVFCGLFPVSGDDFEMLRDAIEKLHLNDASFEFEQETSAALGLGFRCGFLGLLHLEIIQERLEREFDLDLITTSPSVVYNLEMNDGENIELHNPADYPEPTTIAKTFEPWIKATILVPDEYLGGVLDLCTRKRGVQKDLTYVGSRAMLVYELPLNEIVFDFYDKLKSITSGYASFDWEVDGYKESDVVKLSILVNQEPVDALSAMVHRSQAETRGREMCKRLQDLIPRQLFKIALQAAIGGKIVARETVSAMRKDVTAKCYGGDITRKKKLLEKQKKGKKKMRSFGNVEIPNSAFINVLKTGD